MIGFMDYRAYFKDKKITLMGLGVLGRGVGDAEFLARCGARLTITDLKTEGELKESVRRLRKYKNISFTLGGHRLKDFRGKDMVIKAAGVPLDSSYVKEARRNKIPVTMSTALFVKHLPEGVTTVGVTGTRGKSTVAHLIHHILKTTGKPAFAKATGDKPAFAKATAGKRVFLGGNVRGISTLALLPKIRAGDYVVLELDSWQLQGFGEERVSPHVAVFTNFMMDHLNYYKGNVRRYFTDKSHIFSHQTRNDYLVTNENTFRYIEKTYPRGKILSRVVFVKPSHFKYSESLFGEHNRDNGAHAIAVANILGIFPRHITKALASFVGVPGRLEFLREVRGVKIYNDTTATTPDATIAALKALRELRISTKGGSASGRKIKDLRIRKSKIINHKSSKHIVLIAGGADKGLNMSKLAREIPAYCKVVILLPGTGTNNFRFKIKDLRFKNKVIEVKNLKEAVVKGMGMAEKGDVLLFSPAFASFGLFKNEFDRGQQFTNLVTNL